jgi:hypothetical protein
MRLPSCGGSRSWLRNPRARRPQSDFPAAHRAIRIFPLRIALLFIGSARAVAPGAGIVESGLAEGADEALLSDRGDQNAVLEEAARRQAEAARS